MKRIGLGILVVAALSGTVVVMAAAPATTANVPVDSVYYTYLDKLSGMGYISSMPNGSKPYSRAMMAKWVAEAKAKAAEKPMPEYLADELAAMEKEFASDGIKLRSVTAGLA